jgi:predicted amidohydrolase
MARRPFRVACVQVSATNDMAANIDSITSQIYGARLEGAQMVLCPENAVMMEWGRVNILAQARAEDEHPGLAAFRRIAAETGLWLHTGTLHVRLDEDRVANRNYVIGPDGEIAQRYDKIHMFDVDLGNGEVYRESATFRPGDEGRLVDTAFGRLGLTICYDLRFPYLYRALAQAGADFLAVPSAFTRTTGRAHWHVLLRARAIETGCYVFAPAQCGEHAGGRQTYGHSLIVAPWGEILADGGEQPGFILADIDPALIDEARRKVPSLSHDRDFAFPG